jgi:hypothetical protein
LNAPPNKRAWYGMFPQLGAPIGLLLSGGTFLILTDTMSSQDFLLIMDGESFASSLLVVVVVLYPIKITETPALKMQKKKGRSNRFSLY